MSPMKKVMIFLLPSFPSCTWERTCLRNFVAAFLAVTLLSLTACSKLTEDNLQKIHNGMTTDDVKAILGEPTSSQTGSALGIISGTTYVYHTSTSDVKITFVNDKVVTTEGEFK
jgi:outer membrane protein assembly factor BamE (lipoprotein component of BamABCDE complex)